MYTHLLTVCFSLFINIFAGDDPVVQVGPIIHFQDADHLYINGLDAETEIDYKTLVSLFGLPDREIAMPMKTNTYIYDYYGVSFSFFDDKLAGLYINYNPNSTNHFPEGIYAGILFLGEEEINEDFTSDMLLLNQDIEFKCPLPGICGNNNGNCVYTSLITFKGDQLDHFSVSLREMTMSILNSKD